MLLPTFSCGPFLHFLSTFCEKGQWWNLKWDHQSRRRANWPQDHQQKSCTFVSKISFFKWAFFKSSSISSIGFFILWTFPFFFSFHSILIHCLSAYSFIFSKYDWLSSDLISSVGTPKEKFLAQIIFGRSVHPSISFFSSTKPLFDIQQLAPFLASNARAGRGRTL